MQESLLVSQDLVTATVSTLATTDLTAEPRKLSVFWDQMIHHAKTAEKQTELSEIAYVLVFQAFPETNAKLNAQLENVIRHVP